MSAAGEKATLLDYLGHYRDVVERKCADLDAAQLAGDRAAHSITSSWKHHPQSSPGSSERTMGCAVW